MSDAFFNARILNSHYKYPSRPWQFSDSGQPRQIQINSRRLQNLSRSDDNFLLRHALILVQDAPYKAFKSTLKAETNEIAWATLNKATSRPFDKPGSGRIAVKVINHLRDKVTNVFRV